MPVPTVFISYSHRDESWKNRLLPQLHALEQAGIGMRVWHDRKIDGGDQWYPEIQEAMANAAVGVLLISPDFLASGFITKEEVPYLIERQEKHGMLLIPVLVRKCPWKAHRWLADRQMVPRDGKCVAIDFPGDQADAVFSDVAEAVYLHFAQLAAQPQTASSIPSGVQQLAQAEAAKVPAKVIEPPPAPEWPPLDPGRVDLSHLPETGAALFGRDDTLTFLDQTWASQGSDTRVLAFKAQGGVGKSTLINHWLAEMRRDHFRGATRVFGWSFYSQGVREQGAPSADAFVAAALRFFGDETMAASAASPWDKGQRLARFVGAERALLVLDGMEPLQSAQPVDRDKLRDPALEALLRGLAKQSAGLCLITTREPLADLGKKSGIVECDLEQITPQAGRALLRALHVAGTDAELESLAARFGPHALAISLLGVYLHEQPGRRIGPATALEQMPGQTPVDRVLAGFEKWLGPGAEVEALRLLGFFDRPADEGCLRALRASPAIPGLTELLAGMTDADWPRVLARLDKLRLIHARHGDTGSRFVDTHPIIREHFAGQLREKNPDAWREGHRRLYEHLCATTKEGDQPTLADLQPLYQAVAHGCQAGMYEEVGLQVYRRRIHRSAEIYPLHKLGAFGTELGAIASFFEKPWTQPAPALSHEGQAWLLSQAAFGLRAVGRLTEALEPMRAGLVNQVQRQSWTNAAAVASNLSELELTLGEIAGAVGDAEQSVTHADRSGDAFQRIASRTTHADALHQAGRRVEAEARFHEAEQMQAKRQLAYSLLYSLPGFQYCNLLLATPERAAWRICLGSAGFQPAVSGILPETSQRADFQRSSAAYEKPPPNAAQDARRSGLEARAPLIESCHAVSQRGQKMFEWRVPGDSLLDIALDHLTLGRASLYAAILEGRDGALRRPCAAEARNPMAPASRTGSSQHDDPASDEFETARRELDAAVDGLRRAAAQEFIVGGLLTRAWLCFLTGAHMDSTALASSPQAGSPQAASEHFASAQDDLDEAWEIAERGPMKLFMADIHLYRARLFGKSGGVGSNRWRKVSVGQEFGWHPTRTEG
jgi:tetratricopeptide (TPR) repeat protein